MMPHPDSYRDFITIIKNELTFGFKSLAREYEPGRRYHRLTLLFPKDELFGLTSQIRRSVVSIPSNIAEGAGRRGEKEWTRFLYIALGSLSELDTQYQIAVRVEVY